jgi:hypothetical protein
MKTKKNRVTEPSPIRKTIERLSQGAATAFTPPIKTHLPNDARNVALTMLFTHGTTSISRRPLTGSSTSQTR